jgi:hypothetical protein
MSEAIDLSDLLANVSAAETQAAQGYSAVRDTSEFRRVLGLTRRELEIEGAAVDVLCSRLSRALTTPKGWAHGARLRPVQAAALLECAQRGGLFASIRVGGGKTLISFFAARVLFAKRPLLIVPASIRAKTMNELRELADHWRVPTHIHVLTYEKLGRVSGSDALNAYLPDVVIMDEAHKTKSPKAAVSKRIRKYMQAHPTTKVVAMSGTMTKRSLMDYAHLTEWCLKDNAPMPHGFQERTDWSQALDEKILEFQRLDPGALWHFVDDVDRIDGTRDRLTLARRGFRRRLVETPGVVATVDSYEGTSLVCNVVIVDPPKDSGIDKAYSDLGLKPPGISATPDGWTFAGGLEYHRHAREIALGFYLRWNPRPPQSWIEARRDWMAFAREVLRYSRKIDSPLEVAQACLAGKIDDAAYRRWKLAEPDYDIRTEAVWLSDFAIDYAAEWLHKERGIVWVEHREFGERLSKKSGVPYYRAKGLNAAGELIDHARGPSIASIKANCTGRNLQHGHSKNLIMSPSQTGLEIEQLIGRTHRDGQEADEVSVTFFCSADVHLRAVNQCRADAAYTRDTTGQEQKILIADFEPIKYPRGLVSLRWNAKQNSDETWPHLPWVK